MAEDNNVIDLLTRRTHLRGDAKCLGCEHEWEAVAPVGAVGLECPKCGTDRGVMAGLCFPKEGKSVWTCNNDGNQYFVRVAGEGWLCIVCGALQTSVSDD